MTTIIGGSGSSGSTLLRNLLNRQADIYSGPELNFLNKRMLFDDWNRNKALILSNSRKLETGGWFPYPGTRVFAENLGWSRAEMVDLINTSSSVSEFADRLLSRPMKEKGASLWIEKTPSNAYCFSRFLDSSSAHRCIFMCRNPFDTVASLVNRGLSEYFAAGLWVYNSASAMLGLESPRVMTLPYEKLLEDPGFELARIYEFLSLDPKKLTLDANEIVASQGETERSGLGFTQWQHDPRDKVRKSKRSTFETLPNETRQRVVSALNRVEVAIESHPGFVTGREIAEQLGYEWQDEVASKRALLTRQMLADLARRSGLRYSSGFMNYPGRVR